MRKTFLVAIREYLENLRTKTFWIGILAFPVLIVGAAVLGRLMSEAKDLRTYTVLDHSEDQWLSREVFRRIRSDDFGAILEKLRAERAEQPTERSPEELRARAEERLATLPPDHALRAPLELIVEMPEEDLRALLEGKLPSAQTLAKLRGIALRWLSDPAARAQLEGLIDQLSFLEHKPVFYGPEELGEDPRAFLNRKLQEGELFAYFVIGEEPLEGSAGSEYVSENVTDSELRRSFARIASEVVQERRVAALQREKGLTEREAQLLSEPLRFDAQTVTEAGTTENVEAEQKASQFAPLVFVYLLWMAVMATTQMLLTNTVEEKSNRIIEVLLSSVSPLQLMSGKIFGIAATGLTVVASWALCAIVAVNLLPVVVPSWPTELGLAGIIGDPRYLASFLGYFIGGYLFFAALFVGIGAVCNSLKEAQNLQQPIVIVLVVPLIAMMPIINDPNGTLARVLSFIPPFTPFVMMNRAAGPPPLWEYIATTVLLIGSIAVAFWGAAKIFRIGVLMTGKPPRIREIWSWLKSPISSTPAGRQGAA